MEPPEEWSKNGRDRAIIGQTENKHLDRKEVVYALKMGGGQRGRSVEGMSQRKVLGETGQGEKTERLRKFGGASH